MSNDQSSNTPRLSFAVGCFHFGLVRRIVNTDFNFEEYIDEVRSYLREYPNIEEIRISELETIRITQTYFELDDEGEIAGGNGINPWPADWMLEFTIQIPNQVQEQIWADHWLGSSIGEANRFRVAIRYEDDLPVAFVSGVDRNLSRPSDAVILTRRYLEKYAPNSSSIKFQFLGPSPFHANFFVNESDDNFTFNIHKNPGYDDIIFTVPSNIHEDLLKDFQMQIETEIAQELGLYYLAIQSNNRFRRQWEKFNECVEDILDLIVKQRRWFKRVYDLAKVPKLDGLSIDLIQYEIGVEQNVRETRQRIEKLSSECGLDRFRDRIDEEIDEMRSNPTEKFRRIVEVIRDHDKTISDYRTTVVAALIGILAALLGGIAGGLVTLLSNN